MSSPARDLRPLGLVLADCVAGHGGPDRRNPRARRRQLHLPARRHLHPPGDGEAPRPGPPVGDLRALRLVLFVAALDRAARRVGRHVRARHGRARSRSPRCSGSLTIAPRVAGAPPPLRAAARARAGAAAGGGRRAAARDDPHRPRARAPHGSEPGVRRDRGRGVDPRSRCAPAVARSLLVLAALLAATRYEGLFLVLWACIAFALRRRLGFAVALGLVGLAPMVGNGLWAVSHGWLFFPSSILLKANLPELAGGHVHAQQPAHRGAQRAAPHGPGARGAGRSDP